MYEGSQFLLMAQYNRWMNRKLYHLCASLSEEERRRDRGAFFKSLHGTLNHIMFGDKMWMGRFVGEPFAGAKMGQELYADFAALRAERERMDDWIVDWAGKISPQWLAAPFSFTSGLDGVTRTMPAWALVTQLFNHQTHHRGQITTLLMQMGIDPGATDVPWTPELASACGTPQETFTL